MLDLSWVDRPATFRSSGAVCGVVLNLGLLLVTHRSAWAAQISAEAARPPAEATLRQARAAAAAGAPVVRAVDVRIGGMGLHGSERRLQISDLPALVIDSFNVGRSPATVVA